MTKHMSVVVTVAAAALAVFQGACGKDQRELNEELIAQRKPDIEAMVAKIESLGSTPLSELTAKTAAWSGPPISYESDGNAIAIEREEARVIRGGAPAEGALFGQPDNLREVMRLLDFAPYADPTYVGRLIDWFENLRYVVVIEHEHMTKPSVSGDSFMPGSIRSIAHVFGTDGTYYGGRRFQATNSAEINYSRRIDRKTGEVLSDDARGALFSDLAEHAGKAMSQAVAELVPGSQVTSVF